MARQAKSRQEQDGRTSKGATSRSSHDPRATEVDRGATAVDERGAVDGPGERPGVPMKADPEPAVGGHWAEPKRQSPGEDVLHRVGIDGPTPVFGTAQPPHGLSGLLRKRAYRIPEHSARHWMLLLTADRVDVLEDRVGSVMVRPLERLGAKERSERVRDNPLPVLMGMIAGAWVASRAYRRARGGVP